MSFKRDGDYRCSLNILRQRRIKDLFSEEIPEDEAKLLSNGKLTCTVCSNRPIFDTVIMLTVHRKGKKHIYYQEIEQQKREELKELIRKRRHEQYLADGTTNINLARQNTVGYTASQPYDSRAKKKKVKPYERKPRLDLSETETSATDVNSLPGYQRTTLESLRDELCDPKFHTNKLARLHPKESQKCEVKPYTSSKIIHPSTGKLHSNQAGLNWSTDFSNNKIHNYPSISHPSSTSSAFYADSLKLPPPPPPPPAPPPPEDPPCDKNKTNNLSEEEVMKARKYLQLRGAGWKKSWDGKWIKDEDAEFDSDEEPPDLP